MKTYITQNDIEILLITDKAIFRNLNHEDDKIELLFDTNKQNYRFETTVRNLLEILQKADEKLSQCKMSKSD